MVLAEAMAAHLPIVAATSGAIPEVVGRRRDARRRPATGSGWRALAAGPLAARRARARARPGAPGALLRAAAAAARRGLRSPGRPRVTADVVVVTWRARDVLAACLEHLARQTAPCTRDRGRQRLGRRDGGDGPPSASRTSRWSTLGENAGFGARRQRRAWRRATATRSCSSTTTSSVEPGFVARSSRRSRPTRASAMVAGLLAACPAAARASTASGSSSTPRWPPTTALRHRPPARAPGLLAGPSGGAGRLPARAFEAAGGFDARLFAYARGRRPAAAAARRRLGGGRGARRRVGVHLGGATSGSTRRCSGGWPGSRAGSSCAATACCARARARAGAARRGARGRLGPRAPPHARAAARPGSAGWRAAGRGSLPVPGGRVGPRIGLSRRDPAACAAGR